MISRRAIVATSALAGLACGSAPNLGLAGLFGPDPPGVLTLSLIGGADQNPDPSGKASSLAVRVFQLAAADRFESADVFALTEREAQTLGADGLGSEVIVLAPKETRTMTLELKPGIKFIGTAALFRDIDHAQWRATSPIAASGPSKRLLKIGRLSAQLAGG
jgi:type VI secretion system protein VasD